MALYSNIDRFAQRCFQIANPDASHDEVQRYNRYRPRRVDHEITKRIVHEFGIPFVLTDPLQSEPECVSYTLNKDWALICGEETSVFLGKLHSYDKSLHKQTLQRHCAFSPALEILHPYAEIPGYWRGEAALRPDFRLLKPYEGMSSNSLLTVMTLLLGFWGFSRFRHYPCWWTHPPLHRWGHPVPIPDGAGFIFERRQEQRLDRPATEEAWDIQMLQPPRPTYTWYR